MKEAIPHPIPPVGSNEASLRVAVIFPTNHLSTSYSEKPASKSRPIQWIDSAPRGEAVAVEVFLTDDDRSVVEAAFAKGGLRVLRAFWSLQDGSNLGVASHHFDCGPVEFRIPGTPVVPGQVRGEMVFPDTDPQDRGRPARMTLMKQAEEYFELWELGGYEAAKLETISAG